LPGAAVGAAAGAGAALAGAAEAAPAASLAGAATPAKAGAANDKPRATTRADVMFFILPWAYAPGVPFASSPGAR
jgi:hypothetical protein